MMRNLLIDCRLFMSVIFVLADCAAAATSSPLPSDDVLHAKVIEVGRAMGLTEAYRDPTEGLFVWRVKLSVADPAQPPAECPALFAWYLKRIDNEVALHDPMLLLCGAKPRSELLLETRRFQEEFKRRWLEAVGDVALIPPTARTHSQDLEATVLGLLSKESGPRAFRQSHPVALDGFTWRELREINAAILVPGGWHVKRVTGTKAIAAVAYFVTVENIDTRGSFDTGMSLNVLVARSRSEDAEAVAKARIATGSVRTIPNPQAVVGRHRRSLPPLRLRCPRARQDWDHRRRSSPHPEHQDEDDVHRGLREPGEPMGRNMGEGGKSDGPSVARRERLVGSQRCRILGCRAAATRQISAPRRDECDTLRGDGAS